MSAKNPKKLTQAQSTAIAEKLAGLFFDFWQKQNGRTATKEKLTIKEKTI